MNKWLNSTKFIWCPGCPASWLALTLASVFEELGFKPEDTWLVSGIGCTARIANYFTCSTAHTTHGRAIAVAEGIKLADPKKNVFVVSGDGDLLSIGLSHLLHTARRNTAVKVICVNNAIYGMTGGQTSPTTEKGNKTKTHPSGSPHDPLDSKKLFSGFDHAFYSRLDVYKQKEFNKLIKKANRHSGFAFIELVSFCRVNDPKFKNDENFNNR